MVVEKYQREYDILILLTTLLPIFLVIFLFASANSINIEAISSLASNNTQWNNTQPCSSANSISLENQCRLHEIINAYVPQYTIVYFVVLVLLLFTMLDVSFLVLSRYSSDFIKSIFLFILALLIAIEFVYLSNVNLFYEGSSSLGNIFSQTANWTPLLELILIIPSAIVAFSIGWSWFDSFFLKNFNKGKKTSRTSHQKLRKVKNM
jgi:hypothetical protein